MSKKIKPVLIRMDREKYLVVRHRLIDEGVSVSAFINRLIDEHLGESEEQYGELRAECGD
jgi:hypothetical protein